MNQNYNQYTPNSQPNMPVQSSMPVNQNMVQPNMPTPQPSINTPKKSSKLEINPIILVIIIIVGLLIGLGAGYLIGNKTKKCDIQECPKCDNNRDATADTNESNNTDDSNNSDESNNTVNTEYDKEGSFLLSIEDVFTITGRGTVVTGTVERGSIKLNDKVQIVGLGATNKIVEVVGIEAFRKQLDKAEAGDNVGLLLKDVAKEDVQRGQVLSTPNTIQAHTQFETKIHLLETDKGGRKTPLFNNFRGQFYFRTTDVSGTMIFPSNLEMINPGDDVEISITLNQNVALEVGTEFSIREGGKMIGTGTVTKILK